MHFIYNKEKKLELTKECDKLNSNHEWTMRHSFLSPYVIRMYKFCFQVKILNFFLQITLTKGGTYKKMEALNEKKTFFCRYLFLSLVCVLTLGEFCLLIYAYMYICVCMYVCYILHILKVCHTHFFCMLMSAF